MIVGLLRHGRTAWNDAGRMQGRGDVPLSAAGRVQVRNWRLPSLLEGARVVSSPLARATETAALFGDLHVVDALVEMDWGAWEGATIASLSADHTVAFSAASSLGPQFRPPGGETPDEVRQRVTAWLVAAARKRSEQPLLAVTHQGVIRALLAGITGWNMIGRPPVRLADDVVHIIEVDPAGSLRAIEWNVPLIDGPVGRRRTEPL